ncbi:hypothetical protein N568_0104050 [Lactococcus garvieae TRF1]|uniref:Uncharacterized protein n=1 Tax=Lactococcus garvieae TRF1 TaxID=1380772 RepID=V8ASK0_9LACT|nr:hypothetical protein N568_0104050 [Lactococcus garvieae TRF1]
MIEKKEWEKSFFLQKIISAVFQKMTSYDVK